MEIIFNVKPISKARPRMAKNGHIYTPSKTRQYEELIGIEYARQGGKKFIKETPREISQHLKRTCKKHGGRRMEKMKFTIQGRLDGLNEYTQANRSNRHEGAEMKRRNEELVMLSVRKVKIKQPVKIAFRWYEKNSRRDMDNVAFAKKFILDALVKKGVLQDDGWKWVKGFTDEFFIDKKNPRIEVEMEEV